MAKIKYNDQEKEVEDGGPITGACEEFGVAFGCYAGQCGACKIKILEGMDNLSEKTQEESDLGLEDDERLACQVKIKSGEVTIDF